MPPFRLLSRIGLCAGILALLATPGLADMGPLVTPMAQIDDGVAKGEARPDNSVVITSTGESAIRDFHLSPPLHEGERTLAVDVTLLEATESSRGGLLYAQLSDPRSYLLYTLERTEDGQPGVGFYYLEPGQGFEMIWKSSGGALREGTNRLAIVEAGNQVRLLVNGQFGFSMSNTRFGQGRVGVAIWGAGTYQFANWNKVSPNTDPVNVGAEIAEQAELDADSDGAALEE